MTKREYYSKKGELNIVENAFKFSPGKPVTYSLTFTPVKRKRTKKIFFKIDKLTGKKIIQKGVVTKCTNKTKVLKIFKATSIEEVKPLVEEFLDQEHRL